MKVLSLFTSFCLAQLAVATNIEAVFREMDLSATGTQQVHRNLVDGKTCTLSRGDAFETRSVVDGRTYSVFSNFGIEFVEDGVTTCSPIGDELSCRMNLNAIGKGSTGKIVANGHETRRNLQYVIIGGTGDFLGVTGFVRIKEAEESGQHRVAMFLCM